MYNTELLIKQFENKISNKNGNHPNHKNVNINNRNSQIQFGTVIEQKKWCIQQKEKGTTYYQKFLLMFLFHIFLFGQLFRLPFPLFCFATLHKKSSIQVGLRKIEDKTHTHTLIKTGGFISQ